LSEVLIYQFGIGGTGGFLIGYAAKKIAKIIAVFLGLYSASLLYLNHIGVITMNYERFVSVASTSATTLTDFFVSSVGGLPFAASFVGGFALGIKKG
jgi:uncharacterized membrane protein (Fun14 family)